MTELTTEPLCEGCDKPTVPLELVRPRARPHDEKEMLPIPARDRQIIKELKDRTINLVGMVCHRNDQARFEHQEWLLAGDRDVSWHTYFLVRDCIYSVVKVE